MGERGGARRPGPGLESAGTFLVLLEVRAEELLDRTQVAVPEHLGHRLLEYLRIPHDSHRHTSSIADLDARPASSGQSRSPVKAGGRG
jgi:hypothetical protein